MKLKAFTLIEVIVVVAILGIVVAIAAPMYTDYVQKSREAAAREALHKVRSQIELYKFEHQGLAPGYIINLLGVKTTASLSALESQFTATTDIKGQLIPSTSSAKHYGPYLEKLPVNPFNKLSTINYAVTFSSAADEKTGWLYKRDTAEFKLNWNRTDSQGKSYLDY